MGDAELASLPQGRELRVLRAGLAVEVGRCLEAQAIFDDSLRQVAAGPLEERALFGRASCAQRLGDNERSRRDLERYLERYPKGRFAAQARAALGR